MRTQKIGTLNCTILDPLQGTTPERIVILSHGFGAPGDDLVPIGHELIYREPSLAEDTQFIFPAAPLSLDSRGMAGGRAWWMIDLEARIQAMQKGELDLFRKEQPLGMIEASDALLAVVEAALTETGLDPSRLVIGGFSQGSMVSTDVALRMEHPPAGLAVLSGTLLAEERWKDLAAKRGQLKVLQTHGEWDPILPYIGAEWLKELFEQSGFQVDFRPFSGMHQIPADAMDGLVNLILGDSHPD